MLGKIKKSLSNLSKLSGGVYTDEEPKSETPELKPKPKDEPKSETSDLEPKLKSEPKSEPSSQPAIPATDSLAEIEKEMGPFQVDVKQVNGDPLADGAAASDSPPDDKAAEKKAESAPAVTADGKDEKQAKKKKPAKKTIPAWAR